MRIIVFKLIFIVLFSFSGVVQSKDSDVIKYRQNLMKSLQYHAGALGSIMRKKVEFTDNFAYHADAIEAISRSAQNAFKPKVIGGTSSPDIWTNWEDFNQKFFNLANSASEVAKIARAEGVDKASKQVSSLFVCKSCHDIYRIEK
ncbi:MAG: hypothetical protein CBC47_02195 [Alphaproteobacteria bacterium TMED87]|nr:hypothetical protein [Rhodospirillaceae bacterium]OUV10968.1 MAG: hypothetical protein CBC47_02195 [Alphaproteobacteria bacterium TMED87]